MIMPGRIFYKGKLRPKLNLSHVFLIIYLIFFAFLTFSIKANEPAGVQNFSISKSEYWKIEKLVSQSTDKAFIQFENSQGNFWKNQIFWLRMNTFPFEGDPIVIDEMRKNFRMARENYKNSPAFQFGLSEEPTTPLVWITYQFSHLSIWHLLFNSIFLLLIVSQLEKRLSWDWIISVYLLSGFAGGAFYLANSNGSAMAMLGGSGSISGLMAFLSVAFGYRSIKWTYFVSPFRGGYGTIHLPAYFVMIIYLVSDFASLLFSNQGNEGSIAYAAHVGGALAGIVLAGLYLFERYLKEKLVSRWGNELEAKDISLLRDSF